MYGKMNNYSYAAMLPRPEVGHNQSIKPEFGVQRDLDKENEKENAPAMLGYKVPEVAKMGAKERSRSEGSLVTRTTRLSNASS